MPDFFDQDLSTCLDTHTILSLPATPKYSTNAPNLPKTYFDQIQTYVYATMQVQKFSMQ